MGENFKIDWIDAGREPKCAPNPDYPEGIDLDWSLGRKPSCKVELECPAPRCGFYHVVCLACGLSVLVTTAGRPDDPRSVTFPCQRGTAQ
jgi:hypothetical protein